MRRLLYSSLMWKLAAFFLVDWLDGGYGVAAIPTISGNEDEETRQRLKVSDLHITEPNIAGR